jgi:hypothetical protein
MGILTAGGLVLSCLAGVAGAQTAKAAAACLGVKVGSTPTITALDEQKGFSARAILDLNFRIVLPGNDTPEAVTLKIYTPRGHLYQEVLVPVAPEGSAERERVVAGYPAPLKVARVRRLRASDGRAARGVDAPPFPVAGTHVVSSSLYGEWRVEAWPQGASEACSSPFVIAP